jgi:hypothetical protein
MLSTKKSQRRSSIFILSALQGGSYENLTAIARNLIFKKRIEPFFLFTRWGRRRGEGAELFTKVIHLSIADVVCAGDKTVIWFAGHVVFAVFTDVQINIAVRAHRAEKDGKFLAFTRELFFALPAVHNAN